MEAGTCALSPRRFAIFEAHRAEVEGSAFWNSFFLLSFLLLRSPALLLSDFWTCWLRD
jgi:hypothetical protein